MAGTPSFVGLIPICIQMVAQVFNLCMCRLKPAATKNYLMIATLYENSSVGRASVPASDRRPGTAAPPTPAIFHLSLCP